MSQENQLSTDSLNIFESVAMGVAGAAPAFSIAAVMSVLITSVHSLAPASILYGGLAMFGITLAFIHLNKQHVHAGASYAWASRVFGKYIGFLVGWLIVVSSVLFVVSGSIPAATATLLLIAPQYIDHVGWVSGIAALWLSLISWVIFKGIKHASYMQILITGFELVLLLVLLVVGFVKLGPNSSFTNWLPQLAPWRFSPDVFAEGMLIAVFLYCGWDVTLNLSEETKNAAHVSGQGAFWSVIVITALFLSYCILTQLTLSDGDIQRSGTNIIFSLADKIFPRPWSYLAVLVVILSSIGTLETTILQFTRMLFALGRDGRLHARYAKTHGTHNSPWVAVVLIWALGILCLFASSFFSTVDSLIRNAVNSVSFQIALYYSVTGFACAWYFKKRWNTFFELVSYVIWPLLSAIFLLGVSVLSIQMLDWVARFLGLGGIMIGLIPLFLNQRARGG